jgi:NitT/TauT family transport system substrate-binding protein
VLAERTSEAAGTGVSTPRRWKAPILLLSLLLAMTMSLAACGDDDDDGNGGAAGADERQELRIALVPAATLLPSMVAIQEGIFKENGLDVRHTFVQNLATLPGAMGRQFDLGATTSLDVMRAREEGINIVLASVGAKNGPGIEIAGVVTKPDSGIDGPQDLEGKTMGAVAPGGGNIHPSTVFWMQKNGANSDRVRFVEVPHPNQFDQLDAGTIDAVQALEPFKGRMKSELDAKVLVDPVRVVMEEGGVETIDFLSYMAEENWAKENPEAIEKFVKSHQEASEFIEQNEQRAREIFRELTEVPPEVAENIPLPLYETTLSRQELDAWANVLIELGQVPDDYEVNLDELVVTPEDNLEE